VALSVQAEVSDTSAVSLVAAILVVMLVNLAVFLVEAQWEQVIPRAVWSIAGRVLGVLLAGFGVSIIIDGIRASGLIASG
jgi:small neutral amino acid transporter SnatA (MarC family)